jgi:hypothetical protein
MILLDNLSGKMLKGSSRGYMRNKSIMSLLLSVFQDHLCETLSDPLFHQLTPVRPHETSIPLVNESHLIPLDDCLVLH